MQWIILCLKSQWISYYWSRFSNINMTILPQKNIFQYRLGTCKSLRIDETVFVNQLLLCIYIFSLQLGYVLKTSNTQTQTCPGSIPDIDRGSVIKSIRFSRTSWLNIAVGRAIWAKTFFVNLWFSQILCFYIKRNGFPVKPSNNLMKIERLLFDIQ